MKDKYRLAYTPLVRMERVNLSCNTSHRNNKKGKIVAAFPSASDGNGNRPVEIITYEFMTAQRDEKCLWQISVTGDHFRDIYFRAQSFICLNFVFNATNDATKIYTYRRGCGGRLSTVCKIGGKGCKKTATWTRPLISSFWSYYLFILFINGKNIRFFYRSKWSEFLYFLFFFRG